MSCKVTIYHPITGLEVESKLWNQINSEVLNENYADKLYAQTRSEQFLAWFGNQYNQGESISQVVNSETLEPLVVYHSSPYDFDTFDTNKSNELGFHFGTLKAALERFSPGKIVSFEDDISGEIIDIPLEDRRKDLKSDGFSVRPFYLNIRNMIEGVDNIDFDSGKLKDSEDGDLLKYLDEATYSNDFKRLVLAFYQKGKITYDDVNQILTTEDSILSSGVHGPEALRKALGNPDGYWYKNAKEDEGSISYVVFDPKNIKSIYNEGGFSQDENIFYNIKSETAIDFTLKVINALQKIPRKTYPSGSIQGFYNDLIKQGAPKNQIDLLKDYILKNNIQEINVPDLITGLVSEISYTIEINTAKGGNRDLTIKETEFKGEKRWSIVDAYTTMPLKSFKTEQEASNYLANQLQKPTSHYSNLTVPGGTNYTENEIATPGVEVEEKPQGITSKEGVKELFDSNPELADAVYEALGFKSQQIKLTTDQINNIKNMDSDINNGWKLHLSIKGIEPFESTEDSTSVEEIEKRAKNTIRILNSLENKKLIQGYKIGNDGGQPGKNITVYIGNSKTVDEVVKLLSTDELRDSKIEGNLSLVKGISARFDSHRNDLEVDSEKYRLFRYGVNGIPNIRYGSSGVNRYSNEEIPYSLELLQEALGNYFNSSSIINNKLNELYPNTLQINIQTTPQQKATAQQLYSQYLSNFVSTNFDSIISDLQSKNLLEKKCN